jgi:hypothetical protein
VLTLATLQAERLAASPHLSPQAGRGKELNDSNF